MGFESFPSPDMTGDDTTQEKHPSYESDPSLAMPEGDLAEPSPEAHAAYEALLADPEFMAKVDSVTMEHPGVRAAVLDALAMTPRPSDS